MRLSPVLSWALLAAAWLLSGLAVAVAVGRVVRIESPRAPRSRGREGPRPSVYQSRSRASTLGYRPYAHGSRGVVVPPRPRPRDGGEAA